mmetsp:Transcript_27014/g.66625  ORF Transcript_27014/g.66625 Transcript_27014/m.66625 type:complete len:270 (+) Transcript_27014:130-939(+)
MLQFGSRALWSAQRLCAAHNLVLRAGMAGHSKWSTIKRSKGAADVQRGALFAKLGKQLRSALEQGGNTPANSALASAIQKCKDNKMPKDVIERAIEKAEQSRQGHTLRYEGTGPHGVSVIVHAITENKSRTAARLREAFKHSGGNMGEPNTVLFKFQRLGNISLSGIPEEKNDEVMEVAIELGAEELDDRGEGEWIIKCEPEALGKIAGGMKEAGFDPDSSSIVFEPMARVMIEAGEQQDAVGKFLDAIEGVEDVDEMFHDADMNAVGD